MDEHKAKQKEVRREVFLQMITAQIIHGGIGEDYEVDEMIHKATLLTNKILG